MIGAKTAVRKPPTAALPMMVASQAGELWRALATAGVTLAYQLRVIGWSMR